MWVCLRGQRQQAHHALDYVVNIGKVSAHAPLVKNLDGLAAHNGRGKQVQGHVGPAPGAINGKKAQTRAGNAEQMAVGVGHEFIAFLGGRVQTYRVVNIVVHAVGPRRIHAIDRRRRGKKQMPHLVLAAAFKNMPKAQQVGVEVRFRVQEAVAYASLGRKVDHMGESLAGKQGSHGGAVGHVQGFVSKIFRFRHGGKLGQTVFF